MKNCKYCGAELEDEALTCPACGKAVEDEAPMEAAEDEAPVEAAEAAEAAAPETPAEPESPKKKTSRAAVAGLILVALLAVAVVVGKGAYDRNQSAQPDSAVTDSTETAEPGDSAETGDSSETATSTASDPVTAEEQAANAALHNNAYGYRSYSLNFSTDEAGDVTYSYLNQDQVTVTLTPEQVEAMMDTVVATAGSLSLTNRELLYYYDQQFYSFYSAYSSILPYMMNTSQALDEQLDPQGLGTWQQVFLDASLQGFVQTAALYDAAQAAGFTLDEAAQASLDNLEADLDSMAQQYGYSDAAAYLADYFGPAADLESYRQFLTVAQIANGYANTLAMELTFTDEELSAYFDENAESILANYGVEKIDKNVVNVRHILIQPEDTESDESWAAAEAEAQRIYDEWLAGDATEESFTELASEYTQDPGSQSTGGLYEDVYPGQMVTEFNDWCFADERAVGDSGIVKTSYGYHIMYFSGVGNTVYWKTFAEDLLRSERFSETLTALTDAVTQETNSALCVLLDRTPQSVPVTETETEETPDAAADGSAAAETDDQAD